jgi:methionyl-tRNA formyltransferase
MDILFIGCVESSYILLEELLANKKSICGVITKRESKFNSDYKDLTPLCEKYGVKVFYTEDINDQRTIEFVKQVRPDIIYCFGWSQLLKKGIICIPKLGVVGFHPTKLPENRGRHPLIWALVLGLSKTASTFFMIDEKIDNGDIISQTDIDIDENDDAYKLYVKVMEKAKKQVIEITNGFENNLTRFIKQKANCGNVWRKRNKSDGKIDFRMSAKNIYNLVRGLTRPYAGAHFEYLGNEYKVWKCEVVKDEANNYKNIEFGKVLEVYSKTAFLVKAGDDLIKILDCEEINLEVGEYL